MVIATPRRARPLLAVAALLLMALVVMPTASRADFQPAGYVGNSAPNDQNSTLEDAAIAAGIGGLLYWIIAS